MCPPTSSALNLHGPCTNPHQLLQPSSLRRIGEPAQVRRRFGRSRQNGISSSVLLAFGAELVKVSA